MINVVTFYRFLPLTDAIIENLKASMVQTAATQGVRGLVLIGPEGINTTLSGPLTALTQMQNLVSQKLGVDDIHFKHSITDRHPFHEFKVKIKDEIVTLGRPGLVPNSVHNHHLSPEEWDQAVRDPDTVVIDTRNDYEVEIGKFRRARDFSIKEFRDFPKALQQSGIPKDKKVLIYCTGGIRCEKAILELNEQGYENVYQLDGGILNYLEKFPNQEFEGECFVFDYRVAVDQNLNASMQYKLCPHCGQPAQESIECAQCHKPAIICDHCQKQGANTCSKNCAHHQAIGSKSKRQQVLPRVHNPL